MKENKPTENKLKNSTNINWLNVLALGTDTVKAKDKNDISQIYASTFVVLP